MTSGAELTELIPVTIEEEMKRSYLDYAMSVIVSRAIPDVRDGLKPVHRRILFAMHESSCEWNKPFRKSARIVGEVMGKYHPHGDSAIYDSLVRMAQNFSLRAPLIDGQGNFGSMDGDSAAAMRYTESRLQKISSFAMLEDIDRNTVDFQENYDGNELEPVVLPARFPNLLVNGAGGIAVGMATNIPPHNLGEIIDACCLYIDNNDITDDDIMEVVQGPDFPTGGIILGKAGIRAAIAKGRGSIIIRGKATIEDIKEHRQAIIITEIPYQVNKAKMVERIADLVKEKRIEGISDLRDESDKSGVRVVVEIKRDAMAEVVLNQLYSYTPLQVYFGVNMLALDNGRPHVLNYRDVIVAFVKFREEVITRRTNFLLSKARDRAHILIGLSIAVANIDEVISLIKSAPDPVSAKDMLMARSWLAENVAPLIALVDDASNRIENDNCFLTEAQAKAILEMRLQRLTGLEHEKISTELAELAEEIKGYIAILGSKTRLYEMMRAELLAVREQFATPRKTEVQFDEFEHDIESLIQKDEMVVTVTMGGYIKRVPLSTYRAQKRGGKGRSGIKMHEEDIITELFVVNTHTPVLFFSNLGQVYKLKVYKLPLGAPQAKGRALINIFPLKEGEAITTMMPLPEDEELWQYLHIMFASANGNIRRNSMADFRNIPSNGKIAIRLDEDDRLVGVNVCKEGDHILLASKEGKCLRFPIDAVRVFKSRTSDGVRGMRLADDDKVISMSVLHGQEVAMEIKDAYLKIPLETRRAIAKLEYEEPLDELLSDIHIELDHQTIRKMAATEEFILTVTENGYGKRSSAYEYRITNRGGKGIVNIITSSRNGKVTASFPAEDNDHIMLMSDKGTLIRCPVADMRVIGRNSQGVTIFKTSDHEKVVSVARIMDAANITDDESVTDEEHTGEESID